MRKLKECFHKKHSIVSRIFSMVLALAMIVTMVPASEIVWLLKQLQIR